MYQKCRRSNNIYTSRDDLMQLTLDYETGDRNIKLTFSVYFCLYPQKKEWTWDESKMMVMQDPIYR